VFRVSCFVFRVSCFVFRVSGFGFRMQGVGGGGLGVGSRVLGVGGRVSGDFGIRNKVDVREEDELCPRVVDRHVAERVHLKIIQSIRHKSLLFN